MSRNGWRVGAAVLVLVGLVGLATVLPVVDTATAVLDRFRDLGLAGQVAYTAVYAVAIVLLVPGSVLTAGAGLTWGPLTGFLVVWPGAVVGSIASFLLGRTALRDTVAQWVEKDPRFVALDRALGAQGLGLVMLIRLSPVIPFGLLNFSLGLTKISLRDYTIATAVGIIPGTFLFVYLGSTLSSLGQVLDGSADVGAGGTALYWVGLLSTVVVTIWVTRVARRALGARLDLEET